MSVIRKRNLTLKDVALALNTSTATISNAFSRPDQLSAKKRQTILDACLELGYDGPNKAAQILRKGKSNIIALVLADSIEYMVTDPVASSFIQGVTRVLKQHQKHLLLYAGDSQSIRDIVDFVDGFICYGAPRNSKLISQVTTQSKPVVTVDFNLTGCLSVNIENNQAAYEIAKLALKPSDKVAIIGLRLIDANYTCRVYDAPLIDTDHCVTHRRLEGYYKALDEIGMESDSGSLWHIPENRHKYARQAALEALNSHPKPTLILCMSDLIAIEVLQCANELNISVPQELRITGFDGIGEVLRVTPSISTVSQSSVEKGAAAAKILLGEDTSSVVLPYTLQSGGTI
jgi:DNA-binding LacI/PurR family transcriptional regulator